MKVLAIGDIHTKLWILNKVEEKIPDYDAVIFCGDYADNWNTAAPVTIQTWKSLKYLHETYPDKVKLVQGNHDYIYTNYTKTISSGYNGVTQTLLDAPENKELKEWLHNLPIIEHIDGVMYSHAGVLDSWAERYNGAETPTSLWNDLSPLWVRPVDGYVYRSYQVFGHTPHETCTEIQPNVWCIDTFSEYTDNRPIGDYTCLEVIDGTTFNKVQLEKD